MTMLIDKPGFYKLQNGGKVECEHVGKDYAVIRSPCGAIAFYGLNGRHMSRTWPPIISVWTDPPKPLECWANTCKDGTMTVHVTKELAEYNSGPFSDRIAVHMREVTE